MAAPATRSDDGRPDSCADVPPLLTACDAEDDDGRPAGPRRKSGCDLASTEDLVEYFDGTLSLCFGDENPASPPAGDGDSDAVAAIAEEALLRGDEIWSALTKSYGQTFEMDWKHSRTRSLHAPAFTPQEMACVAASTQSRRTNDLAADTSEADELREQLDMHAIVVPGLGEEPIFTAEQVIEEIEEMMQDSLDVEAEGDPSRSDLSTLSLDSRRPGRSPSCDQRVRGLDVAALSERAEETELAVRRLSEELVRHLALRDELDFEKEVKNAFISALIDVQNRRKERREALKKKKKKKTSKAAAPVEKPLGSRFSVEGLSSVIQNGFRQTFGSACSERQYLTTVIPYENKGRPPSVEDLQILIKILHAMRDDSDKVPALLTDYILKVLCPT
ncbi:fasciculation and elongation protein zeta-2 isoform X2 [Syngnathoides biaculeatus]|uniref:fasciculation and elongation protein zeta-2 isoform X2 n=1 Tax=Syngnathoides biaculeatus TaxID=300417 RepID=UPI002ADDB4F3|nr:fasciculation and elongation protein zeta-2 isoform X2 [Syngnathoides biaculeatus]